MDGTKFDEFTASEKHDIELEAVRSQEHRELSANNNIHATPKVGAPDVGH